MSARTPLAVAWYLSRGGGKVPVATKDEERIARAERLLAVTQQITHIGSWEWELATNTVTWSDELYRIYGLEPRSIEITFETFLVRVHPEDRDRTTRAVRAALESGGGFAYPERILRPDGTTRELETRGEAIRDRGGNVVGLLGTCRDVTAERKREETLTLFEDVVHNVQIGLAVWQVADADDPASARLISFNPAAEAIARRPLLDSLGKSVREIVSFAEGGTLEQLILGVARDGVVREGNVTRSRDPRDPNRAVSMKAFPLPASCVGLALEDTSEQSRSRRMRDAEAGVLEMIVAGETLGAILETLAQAVDEELPGCAPAIVLLDHESTRRYGGGRHVAREAVLSSPILASDGRSLGALELLPGPPHQPPEWQREIVSRATRIAGIAIERRQLEEQLRALSEHVESVREEERTGIAREIHDELGQALTALKMDIAWIGRRSKEPQGLVTEAVRDHLLGMSQLTDEIIDQVRRISAELRPGVLDDLGLLAAIEWQAQEFERRTGTTCTVQSNMTEATFERRLATGIFRILQEALTNVARHAQAKRVEVSLELLPEDSGDLDDGSVLRPALPGQREREWIELSVRDDGVGLAHDRPTSRKSLGLLGIRERARNLGGSATIVPAAERGTLLTLRVPYVEGTKGGPLR